MRKVLLFICFVCILFTGMAFGAESYVNSKISAIAVLGNTKIPTQNILPSIFSKVGENIDKDKINNDLKSIYALGYFTDVKVSYEPYQDGTKVIYKVFENPVLTTITIKGNTVYPTTEAIKIMGLVSGEVFSYKILREGIEALNIKYKNDGYTLARVVDVSSGSGTVEIKLVEGIVESVSLEGNEVTKDYVILREMKTKPGKVFNEDVFAKDIRRVFNLGFFSEIIPAFGPGASSDKITLTLGFKETKSNTINFGGGYGEREGWFGFTDLAMNNLMGTAQSIMIRGQAGQQLTTYQFKYSNPWFIPEKLGPRTAYTFRVWDTMGTDIYVTQQNERHTGWDMSFGKNITDYLSSNLFFGIESVAPANGATFEAYTSDSVGVSFAIDTRDNWMNPTKGMFDTISLKQGWTYSSTQSNFLKLGLDVNNFTPIANKQVLAMHVGTGIGFGVVPIGELYWAGGPNTVRGYSLDQLKRGARKLILNFEYRYTFNETFQGVLFYDLGNAWNTGNINLSDFISGWGPGIRFNTPLGPIRLDYGMPLTGMTNQGILHFSIGQAF